MRINSADDGATRVKIGELLPGTSEMTRPICVLTCMYLYWAKIDLHTFIHLAVIEKSHGVLEHVLMGALKKSGGNQATTDINLVGF